MVPGERASAGIGSKIHSWDDVPDDPGDWLLVDMADGRVGQLRYRDDKVVGREGQKDAPMVGD
jgi:hypothetical protein